MTDLEHPTDAPAVEDFAVDWANSTDVLSAFVQAAGLRGLILASLDLGAPWRVESPASRPPVLHYVVQGEAFVTTDQARASVRLGPGDALMLPSGGRYVLLDDPHSQVAALSEGPGSGRHGCSLRGGGDGARTKILCYRYRFRDAGAVALLQLLPATIVARADEGIPGLRGVLAELARESALGDAMSDGIVSRLAEAAYLCVLRQRLNAASPHERGLLAALADPQLGAALRAVHASLETHWTVAGLASRAGLSRAAFSRRFSELTDDSPMHYVQRCRMQAAARWMSETRDSIADIAGRVGYADQAAFSRAFRRELGVSPSAYKRGLSVARPVKA